MDPSGFANPWEHARLLSDRARNDAMIAVIRRHAPGARVLEVGCGSGLLCVLAARAGATRVYGVEPTSLVEVARELVAINGLQNTVEILEGMIEDVEPHPVDLAFSELLNADPFFEGVVSAMAAAKNWIVPGGVLAPRRLVVKAALARVPDSAREVRDAHSEIARLAAEFDVSLGPIEDILRTDEPYTYLSNTVEICSTAAVAFDIELGTLTEVPERVEVVVEVVESGPVSGAVVWFEAEMMDDLVLANPPGGVGHWGQMVCAFATEQGYGKGDPVRLELVVDEDSVEIRKINRAG